MLQRSDSFNLMDNFYNKHACRPGPYYFLAVKFNSYYHKVNKISEEWLVISRYVNRHRRSLFSRQADFL